MEYSERDLARIERYKKRREIFKHIEIAADIFDELYPDNATATLDFHRPLRTAQYILVATEHMIPDGGDEEEE